MEERRERRVKQQEIDGISLNRGRRRLIGIDGLELYI